jgi:hypothetical protein
MLLWLNAAAVSVAVDLSELCSKEKDLSGVVNPQEKVMSELAAPWAEPAAPFPNRGQGVAANGAVLAALTSVLINIPIVARAGGQPALTKPLARALLIVT